jgi:hypothetical protein
MVRWLLCCAALSISLAACSPKPEEVAPPPPVILKSEVPEELRDCPFAPTVPGVGATQKDVARYVAKLHQAHKVCRTNLLAVDRILDEQDAEAVAE